MPTSPAPTAHWAPLLPWLRQAVAAWKRRTAASTGPVARRREVEALAGLSDRALRDVGAPDWMLGHERGPRASELERARARW